MRDLDNCNEKLASIIRSQFNSRAIEGAPSRSLRACCAYRHEVRYLWCGSQCLWVNDGVLILV